MRLAYKIYLITAIFVFPLVCLAIYFILIGLNKDIDFASQEIIGIEYQRPLESVLDHVGQHYLMAERVLSGDKSATPSELLDLNAQINRDFEKLVDVNNKYGQTLQFTPEGLAERHRDNASVSAVKQQWAALVAIQDSLTTAGSEAKHFELIKSLRMMIDHVGDKSNLILDPDLDSYYVMDMTLSRLPEHQERLAKAASFGAGVLNRSGLFLSETRKLDTYAALLMEVDRDAIITDMQTALEEDKNFYGTSPTLQANLKPKVDASMESTAAFAKLLEKISTGKADIEPKKFAAAGEQARRDSFQLWDTAVTELETLLKLRIDDKKQHRLYALLITLAILTVAGIASYFIIGTISSSIQQVSGELRDLSTGDADLTRRVTVAGSFELKQLAVGFNTLMGKLLELIRQVQQSGAQVTSSSTEIAASTKQLEAAVTEQAASTNEVVATTKEISATSQTLANTMGEVGKVASDTAGLAGAVQNDLDGMGNTMRQLADATGSISSKLSAISEKANNINKIVITITKVADQTNLLSLNASIEAEKAGEHGLGFAVVAREIRRLADQTAVATLDIERMVKDMHSAVSTGVMEMDKFTRDVGRGVEEVNDIGGKLANIVERVQMLAPRFETVTEGMLAQSQGAQQISTAMVQLSEAARQTMDSLRQTNSAIIELNSAARGLHVEVSRFGTGGK